jgi:hypothetical protein
MCYCETKVQQCCWPRYEAVSWYIISCTQTCASVCIATFLPVVSTDFQPQILYAILVLLYSHLPYQIAALEKIFYMFRIWEVQNSNPEMLADNLERCSAWGVPIISKELPVC